jgi:hypothetical protein
MWNLSKSGSRKLQKSAVGFGSCDEATWVGLLIQAVGVMFPHSERPGDTALILLDD